MILKTIYGMPWQNKYRIFPSFSTVASTSSLTEFAIAALHAKPDDAVVELDASVDVYDYIAQTSTEVNRCFK